MGRPQFFTIDPSHQLARGLVFAGLGNAPGSVWYRDSSAFGNHGTLTGGIPSWGYKNGRPALYCDRNGSNTNDSVDGPNIPVVSFSNSVSCVFNFTSTLVPYPANYMYAVHFGTIKRDIRITASNGDVLLTLQDADSHGFNITLSSACVANTTNQIGFITNGAANTASVIFNGVVYAMTQNGAGFRSGYWTTLYTWQFGRANGWNNAYPLNGYVWDPCVWTRSISTPEIQQLANPANYMLSGLIRPIGSEFNIYDREGIR